MDSRIVKNTAINFAGLLLPTFVSLATVPAYVHLLGLERFGAVALIWVLIDYFNVLGFAMSVATQNQIAPAYSSDDLVTCRDLLWSAFWSNLAASLVIGIAVYVCGWAYSRYWMDPTATLTQEVRNSLPLLALAVPVASGSCVFSAALAGAERFAAFNMIQTSGTILFQLVPLFSVWLFGPTVGIVLGSAIIVRSLTALQLLVESSRVLKFRTICRPRLDTIRRLLNFGGWMLATTVVTMVTDSIDRLVVGATFGARTVACYTVPKNLVMRLNIVSIALGRTLFPRLSAASRDQARVLTQQSLGLLVAIFTPLSIMAMTAIGPFLQAWVGGDLALIAAPIGRALIIAMWLGGQADVTRILIQSQVSAASAARASLLQLCLYMLILYIAINRFGLMGAAVATVLRAMFEYLLLVYVSRVQAWPTILCMLSQFPFLLADLWLTTLSLGNLMQLALGAVLVVASLGLSFSTSLTFQDVVRSSWQRLSPKSGV
ncbi:Polysaccharide biosynthesis protein [Burkholderia sp. 8Y]|uniref:oligosaccharide flippase family protein n=1 Tax=Burkholderia sp. 8Y TaxID=2653133 RepID=UPI0012F0E6F9|nr:oligosaccharide flippase family protein [Burkholderia sp. 8Y]VXC90358.1 Polysaccharide biosynthesis protein [Burkholderia sp. 8Y]